MTPAQRWIAFPGLLVLMMTLRAAAQSPAEAGIPVTDPLLKAKCGECHETDASGNMQRVSWERATSDGWTEALKRMQLLYDLELTPAESNSIIHYLSSTHGLAPEETKLLRHDWERRIHEETSVPEQFTKSCTRCHRLSRVMAWRRSADDWRELANRHNIRYDVPPNEAILAYLNKVAPLHPPEWESWIRAPKASLEGRWIGTAHIPGKGTFLGEWILTHDPAKDLHQFEYRGTLRSVKDGSAVVRSGSAVVYGDHAWRGTSKGVSPSTGMPDDPASETTDVLWISSDQNKMEGRLFWGQYQEFGMEVALQRPAAGTALLVVDRSSLKVGVKSARLRVFGEKFPAQVAAADLKVGDGVTIRRIVSHTATEIGAEVDVAADAAPGRRDVSFRGTSLPGAIAVYDRVDYVTVTPESSLASYAENTVRGMGYQQFEAIGYQRGPDGKRHTEDDLMLGPVDVTWSLKVFYEAEKKIDLVGTLSSGGLFTPAAKSPNTNFDVWAVATMTDATDPDGRPLVGKGYLVVTVPYYTFRGHRYVRDLDRWIDDGPADGAPSPQ